MIKEYLLSAGFLFFGFVAFAQAPNQLMVNIISEENCFQGTTTLLAQAPMFIKLIRIPLVL
ncbi:hypothetical protein LZZ90_11025 [Flavobacterium sp. SM15]|uniref:hypothetical protein n=1 Tax=Flavobacterium sp. SM15 TaxID=2908005 RepID=UPI001EDB60F1|nr:hypothetical protein [Flavobacterium sp. SM15]MCG2612040.1 hypothetical protein [Flavobacterium sp. SM15]